MKRIFLLLLSASVTAVVSCSGGGSTAGKPGTKGELIPREKSRTFVAERPYGMVAIPGGSFVAGLADEDPTNQSERAPLKTVTVSSFFIDEAETTNAEYRVFVNYVRDSIARTLLAEAAGEGGREHRLLRRRIVEEGRCDHPLHRLQAPLPLPARRPAAEDGQPAGDGGSLQGRGLGA